MKIFKALRSQTVTRPDSKAASAADPGPLPARVPTADERQAALASNASNARRDLANLMRNPPTEKKAMRQAATEAIEAQLALARSDHTPLDDKIQALQWSMDTHDKLGIPLDRKLMRSVARKGRRAYFLKATGVELKSSFFALSSNGGKTAGPLHARDRLSLYRAEDMHARAVAFGDGAGGYDQINGLLGPIVGRQPYADHTAPPIDPHALSVRERRCLSELRLPWKLPGLFDGEQESLDRRARELRQHSEHLFDSERFEWSVVAEFVDFCCQPTPRAYQDLAVAHDVAAHVEALGLQETDPRMRVRGAAVVAELRERGGGFDLRDPYEPAAAGHADLPQVLDPMVAAFLEPASPRSETEALNLRKASFEHQMQLANRILQIGPSFDKPASLPWLNASILAGEIRGLDALPRKALLGSLGDALRALATRHAGDPAALQKIAMAQRLCFPAAMDAQPLQLAADFRTAAQESRSHGLSLVTPFKLMAACVEASTLPEDQKALVWQAVVNESLAVAKADPGSAQQIGEAFKSHLPFDHRAKALADLTLFAPQAGPETAA